jgi:hypothetical protein
MSYYILPKNNNIILVDPQSGDKIDRVKLSYSIYHYYYEMYSQINNMCKNENDELFNNFNELIKIINPYEFIFSKVPGSKYSVSKLKTKNCLCYDLLEIFLTFNIFENFNFNISSLYLAENNEDYNDCYSIMREHFNDNLISYKKIVDEIFNFDRKFNFMFIDTVDTELNNYFINVIQTIMLILKCCQCDANVIIKIDHSVYNPIIEYFYLLCSLFDKVYIIKPHSNNITTFDKYIVCKGFIYNEDKMENYKLNYFKLLVFLKKLENKNIVSILNKVLPYYFINKIDDINIILGQQQLESFDQIITILKSKNKEDKIETIKKSNIQKAVSWCEKYKIPCNKFIEKTNIFLPIIKEENNVIETES